MPKNEPREIDYFVDSDNKVILECPDCGNQSVLYLVRGCDIIDGLQPVWCDSCKKPYIASVSVELKTKIKIWGTKDDQPKS